MKILKGRLLMKMSGTGQKGTGKRNYSILMRHLQSPLALYAISLSLIFLRLRWFAPHQCALTLYTRHELLRLLDFERASRTYFTAFREFLALSTFSLANHLHADNWDSTARNLLSISYYSRKTCLFSIRGRTLRFAERFMKRTSFQTHCWVLCLPTSPRRL